MAIFHCSVKAISRKDGRSATASAAYRAGEKITDKRTGEIHDYTRKGGVESADIVLPDGAGGWSPDRQELWNAAEASEKRKDSTVAREIIVALPHELDAEQRKALALEFAKSIANAEGGAVDVAIHKPNKQGDQKNYHAHLLKTTRKIEKDGLGAKLDSEKTRKPSERKQDLERLRQDWADLTNQHLERAGHKERVDHRTLKAQGIERTPGLHLGVAAIGYERRTGKTSYLREKQEAEAVTERLKRLTDERETQKVGERIIELNQSLSDALKARDAQSNLLAKAGGRLGILQERLKAREAEQERQRKEQEERQKAQEEQRKQQEREQRREQTKSKSRGWER